MSETTPTPQRWNPRYAAYAAREGLTPEAILALDRERYPGGCMAGFSLWIQARWFEFRSFTGSSRLWVGPAWVGRRYIPDEQPIFDDWLLATWPLIGEVAYVNTGALRAVPLLLISAAAHTPTHA